MQKSHGAPSDEKLLTPVTVSARAGWVTAHIVLAVVWLGLASMDSAFAMPIGVGGVAVAPHGQSVNMTLCRDKCSSGCVVYMLPGKGECFNPRILFPGDKQWGPHDVRDICLNKTHMQRVFYDTKDASCMVESDHFVLPIDVCIGPFEKPRPWGIFSCISSS